MSTQINQQINAAEEIAAYPIGSVFTDCKGDVWMFDSITAGCPVLISPETSEQGIWYILKHYGPLTLRWRPDQQPTAQPTVGQVVLREAAYVLERRHFRNVPHPDNIPCPGCRSWAELRRYADRLDPRP